jgi:putative protein-disulfide isomerase
MNGSPELIYVHDPMCSWCWGFGPALDRLIEQLPPSVATRRLLGGLAPDSDQPMAAEMQQRLQDTWRRIQQRIPGTRFNFDFWRLCAPRRSTWPACRAVIAARSIDAAKEPAMIAAIQRAYYLEARNPSDDGTLIELAAALGLARADFERLLNDPATQGALDAEMAEARALGATSFPSLRLRLGDSAWPVPVDYTDSRPMREAIEMLLDA